ncbi:MAG: SUMF1/EgtB/PvdO family nonheme iron enzyme [Planctomycetes bacterium]|jgi:formylglycine-generating enzyme required for sulfatase activity|nr:SUMF1/EgtB/PvdO family nonheme iron enzyme [Planctomycetota bacterium]
MKCGRNARRFRRMAAVFALASVAETVFSATLAGAPNNEVQTVQAGAVPLELVRIPAGRFLMGSSRGDRDERPVHEVFLADDFYMGKTEVTVRQFRAFVEATGYTTVAEREGAAWHTPSPGNMKRARRCNWRCPGFESSDDHPVVCLCYLDAAAFCAWLSARSGQPIRLPTEAEWEYACCAGTPGDAGAALGQAAWLDAARGEHPHPVAQRAPSAWGLYDMLGNAAEWCADLYHWDYAQAPADGSANFTSDVPADAALRRVLRGGSWCSPPTSCRPSFRGPAQQALRATDTGFRVVRSGRTAAPGTSVRKRRRPAARSVPDLPAVLALHVDGTTFDFVRICPGRFMMGSPHHYVDEYNWTYEMPAREVTIDHAYYMGVTEVTVEQFRLFVEQTGYLTDAEKQGWAFVTGEKDWHFEPLIDWRCPGHMPTDREPVVCLGWYDAVAFCQWLSQKTGRRMRLPSEAEWEYACRAGTTGDHAGCLGEVGWYAWNSGGRTQPVARKKPNAWGLYDMQGNAWEWVQDLYHRDGAGAPSDGSAWCDTAAVDPRGITRGGSFYNPEWLCRSYIRMQTPLGHVVHYNNGLRLVCEVSEPGN